MQPVVMDSGNVTVVVLEGRVDSTTSRSVAQAFEGILEGGATKVVVDLEAVEYVSSDGLREMVAALKRLREVGGELRVAAPTALVREVFALSGLDSILSLHESRQEAVSSF